MTQSLHRQRITDGHRAGEQDMQLVLLLLILLSIVDRLSYLLVGWAMLLTKDDVSA